MGVVLQRESAVVNPTKIVGARHAVPLEYVRDAHIIASMNHDNRNWRRRWTLYAAEKSALHESGITVRFVMEHDCADIPIATLSGRRCCDSKLGTVVCVLSEAEINAWTRGQIEKGIKPARLQQRLDRLMREAGEIWAARKNQAGVL